MTTELQFPAMLTISSIRQKSVSELQQFYEDLHAQCHKFKQTHNIFISITPLPTILSKLSSLSPNLPLYGIPFTAKDNIDAPPLPTTCACEPFSHVPLQEATVITQLQSLGAILLGKTNMDTFSTGLVGTRSPTYGVVRCLLDENYVGGGSSSGAAASVRAGLCVFALGTDTAGSGRVPAAMQGIVGIKPTKGMISIHGVVPACKSIDCVSLFTPNVNDGYDILTHLQRDNLKHFHRLGKLDYYMRPIPESSLLYNSMAIDHTIGSFKFYVPEGKYLDFQNDEKSKSSFEHTVDTLKKISGTQVKKEEKSFESFDKVSKMLYEKSFVSQRYASIHPLLPATGTIDETVKTIVVNSEGYKGWQVYDDLDLLQKYTRDAECDIWNEGVNIIVVPTVPTVYKVDDVLAEPVKLNSKLGTYTNFVNLMDYCAIAIPSVQVDNGKDDVPRGITLIARAFQESLLFNIAKAIEKEIGNL